MKWAIEVENLSKAFQQKASLLTPWKRLAPVKALERVTFRIPRGSVFALLGPNGAGKTTLLKILSALLLPEEGVVRVNGHSIWDRADRIRQNVSFAMGEERSFYWRLTGRQNLEFFAVLYNLSKNETAAKIREAADVLNLHDLLDRPFEEYSTGNRQRLALARSFFNDAPVLLADEPTRSLDPLAKRDIQTLLLDLSRRRGKTILLTTHDTQEAGQLADRVGILHRGILRAEGSIRDLCRAGGREIPLETVMNDLCREDHPDHASPV